MKRLRAQRLLRAMPGLGGVKPLLALLALSASAQTVDLSGPWRITARDVPANALVSTDDSSWATVSLPLGDTRLAPGTWLRRTVEVPAGAEQLVLGRLRASELYFDGVRQTVPDSPGPNLHRLKPGSRKVVIAIRVSWAVPGANQVAVDKGPYLVAPDATARQAVEDTRLRMLQRQSPFVLLGGVQITLAIALFVIWVATGRQYSALLWAAAYMVFASYNLLRLSAFPGMPATPRLLPAILSLQIALAIIGRDSTRMLLMLWGAYAALLLLLGDVSTNTVAWASPGIQFLTVATVTVGAWKRDRSTRFTGLVVGLYWLIPPSAAVVGRSLVFENVSGYWPLLGLLNVPLALSVVLLFLARFSEDRRERSRLNNEFEAARTVQQMLLPETTVRTGEFLMEAVYEPAQEVGGDFHWSRTATDGSLLMAVGDVSGKGLKAALQVSVVIGILRNEKALSCGCRAESFE